jgi:transcription initiation factor IIE alpha subunit
MEVKVTLDLDKLKERLCPKCREEMDRYLKELAIEALEKDTKKEKT